MAGEESVDGAYHGDNIAPSLFGGMIFIKDNPSHDFYRIPLLPGLKATILLPNLKIVTKNARSILSNQVDFSKSNRQSSNIAGLMIGFYTSNLALIKNSLKDEIIEEQRAKLIPGFYDVKEAALQTGALGCSISGAGPAIFCLSQNNLIAEEAGIRMQEAFQKNGIESKFFLSDINQEGSHVC
jgi:homoserine kinase